MKKRIIASILVVVMLVLSLASCGTYSFTSDKDLSKYATFNKSEFVEALSKIEIEDGDFTTNEETRTKKVLESIYSSIANTVINNAKSYEFDKLEEGTVGDLDVIYFCYYAEDKDGNIHFFANMRESTLSTTSHYIKLGAIDEDNELQVKIAEAVKGFNMENYYSMKVAADLDDTSVKAGDTIVVSYTREYTVTGDNDATTVYTSKAVYETITLTEGDPLSDILLNADNTVAVGSTVKVKDGNSTKTTFTVTEEIDGTERACSYSSFKIEWLVDKAGTPVTVQHNPYEKETEVTPDSLYTTTSKVKLGNEDLTYYIYPVYRLSVPETTAESILELIVGKNITDTYFDAFENENYKFADNKTLSDIVSDLKKIWAETYEDGSDLDTLKDAYTAAEKAVKDAGKDVTAEQETALSEAEEAYIVARRAAIKAEIAKILAATNDNADDKPMSEAIVEEHKKNTKHSLTESYNEEITNAVEKAVWDLIDKSVKVTSYPEKLLKDYQEHIYNEYEHKFYKENYTPSGSTTATNESNYAHYLDKGGFDQFLLDQAKKLGYTNFDEALVGEAKAAVEPLIKLYVVAYALEEDAKAVLEGYIQSDIDAGAYDSNYKYNESLSDRKNEKAKAEAEKQAEENKKEALESAKNFIITDEVFREYKRDLGSSVYRSYEETYGEINIRAALQFNRLFYYLTSTNIVITEEGGSRHAEPKYVPVEGGDPVLDFRTIKYSIKADTETDTDTNE